MDLAVQITQWSLARCFTSTYVPSLQFHSTKPFVLPCSSHSSSKSRHSLICNDKKGSSYTSSAFMELPLKNPEEANFTLENTEQADEEYEKETPEEFTEDFTDGTLAYDKAYFDKWLQDEEEDEDIQVGDGGEGGGILLAGTWWDKEALRLAEEVSHSFNNDLKLYAFKTKRNSSIYLRIEKMSTKYGSPSLEDIQAFCSALQLRLDKAEGDGTIPEDMFLKVSSPGIERVVRVPDDLERFKEKPMYVKYTTMNTESCTIQEADGIFSLISFDLQTSHCTWGIADVKINRQKGGKGRALNKKQRLWRLHTPFDALRLVRLYPDF